MEPEVGLRLATQRLTALLGEPRYRRRWVRYSSARRGQPSRAAVAAVLAEHLFETGQVGWDHQPRSLENRVGRALNGQRLSDRTLELFIAAFAMTAEHADELRSLRSGRSPARQLVVAAELSGERPMPPRPWRILQLAEEHHVGADRCPRLHRTRQLMTPVERTDRYHYAFDTPHAAVTVHHGGIPVGAFRVPGSPIHVVEVALPRSLLPGQSTHLEYETAFCYPGPPAPECRRAVSASVRHLAMTVHFHPAALPRELLWGSWASIDQAEPDRTERVELVDGQAAVAVVPDGDRVLGFTWRW